MTATLLCAKRLVTCVAVLDDPLGVVEPGAVLFDADRIGAVGSVAELERAYPQARRIEHPGLVTPGLVDAHTHAAWVGSRSREYAMRMAGADYEAIAAQGGGIVASMNAVREATGEQIASSLRARLQRMAALGVTTVEVKSGYGLSEAAERKQLEAIQRVGEDGSLPRLVATFLGLHAVPPEHRQAGLDRSGYARACRSWLDGIAKDRLAAFVDAYLDRGAFSVDEARPVLERACELGLGVRLHVGQFADVGGAQLAAELGAKTVDHLEHVSPEAALRLAAAGTSVVLLPIASYTLKQAPPDVAMLRRAGVALVVASDANPGTAPSESLPLALSFAACSYGLTLAEVIQGATVRARSSLGLDSGALRPGGPADLVAWDFEHETELLQPWGTPRAKAVWRGGRLLSSG